MKKLILGYVILLSAFTFADDRDDQKAAILEKITQLGEAFAMCRSLSESREDLKECHHWVADKLSEIGREGREVDSGLLSRPAWFLVGNILPFTLRKMADRIR